jgi:8-oxo-dGTP diphosphatase
MSSPKFTLIPAVHLFLFKGETVLLTRRFNTSYEDGNYSVPAGHVDGNEPMTQAMIREAREEVGIEIKPEDLKFGHVMHRIKDDERVDFFFTCQKWTGTPKICEEDKCDELLWAPIQSLPKNVIPYVSKALQYIRIDEPFSEVGWEI